MSVLVSLGSPYIVEFQDRGYNGGRKTVVDISADPADPSGSTARLTLGAVGVALALIGNVTLNGQTLTEFASPLSTKGDLFGHSTVDARIPVGTNGQVLTADSAQALGLKWADAAAYTFSTGLALGGSTVTNKLATGVSSTFNVLGTGDLQVIAVDSGILLAAHNTDVGPGAGNGAQLNLSANGNADLHSTGFGGLTLTSAKSSAYNVTSGTLGISATDEIDIICSDGDATLHSGNGTGEVSGTTGARVSSANGSVTISAGNSGGTGNVVITAGLTSGNVTARAGTDVNIEAGAAGGGGSVNIQSDDTGAVNIQSLISGKLGFYSKTGVVQQVLATGAGHTVDQIITFLQLIGLCKQS